MGGIYDCGYVLAAAAILFGFNVVSLFFPHEGFRGLGRIAYGISTSLLGVVLFAKAAPASIAAYYGWICGGFVVGGLAVSYLGYRKFKRRNLPQGGTAQ